MSNEALPEDEQGRPPRGSRLPPIAYPALAVAFIAVLVWAFSRVLLAVSTEAAPVIGLLMALNILVGAALVAFGGRVRRRPASFPLLVGAGLAVIAAGVVAMAIGEHPLEGAAEAGGAEGGGGVATVTLVAQNIQFDQKELSFAPGAQVTMTFDNKDSGVPHNFVLFDGPDAQATPIFQGDLVTGPATATYRFTAPAEPGSYFFHCEVHPTQMTGTVKVGEGEGGPPGGGGPGGGTTVVAKDLQFHPASLTASPSGGQVTITFDNQDAGVQHNIAVFRDETLREVIFRGDIITGPAKQEYTFRAPPPGQYYFHCDVHPTMKGTLTLE